MIQDYFFQIVLFLAGAILSSVTPLMGRSGQKFLSIALGISFIIISIMWFGYELGSRESISTNPSNPSDGSAVSEVVEDVPTDTPSASRLISTSTKEAPLETPIRQPTHTPSPQPSATPLPIATEIPTPTPVIQLMATVTPNSGPISSNNVTHYTQDFSSGAGDWFIGTDANERRTKETQLVDGQYRFTYTAHKGTVGSGVCLSDYIFDNFIFSVDATPVDGPYPLSYRIVFRDNEKGAYSLSTGFRKYVPGLYL